MLFLDYLAHIRSIPLVSVFMNIIIIINDIIISSIFTSMINIYIYIYIYIYILLLLLLSDLGLHQGFCRS